MKLTSTYTVANNGGNTVITTNLKDNMTESDVKKMIIDQMKKWVWETKLPRKLK